MHAAGMAGTSAYMFWIVPASMTEEELGEFAWQCARIEHAYYYGVYPISMYGDDTEIEADPDSYSDNIEGYYVDYDPQKHDGYTVTGTPTWNTY